jgi:hypothetical protein
MTSTGRGSGGGWSKAPGGLVSGSAADGGSVTVTPSMTSLRPRIAPESRASSPGLGASAVDADVGVGVGVGVDRDPSVSADVVDGPPQALPAAATRRAKAAGNEGARDINGPSGTGRW